MLPLAHFISVPEERAMQKPSLGGRKARLRQDFDGFACNPSLLWREESWLLPVHPCSDMLLKPSALTCDCVGASVQLFHLLKKRLELLVVDRHFGSTVRHGAR